MNACVDCLAALLDHPPHIVVCDAKIVGIVRLCADPRENSAFFGSSHASGGTIYLLESGVRRRPKPKMAMSGSCQISRHSRTRPAFPAGKGGRATTAMRLTIIGELTGATPRNRSPRSTSRGGGTLNFHYLSCVIEEQPPSVRELQMSRFVLKGVFVFAVV